jgi:hypothetical protein
MIHPMAPHWTLMQTRVELIAPCGPGELFFHVSDLDRYPVWIGGLVYAAERLEDDSNDQPAWWVELRSRIGPLARSKKLRMVRTEIIEGHLAVFERREVDGREHSNWRLQVEVNSVAAVGSGPDTAGPEEITESHLEMTLTYEGRLWTGGILEKVLQDQIDRGRDQLLNILTQPMR